MDQAPVTPIAVIGMGCRLPGGIDSPEQLWEALLRGDDLVTEVPADRWDADEYYDPEPGVPGRSVSKWGAFLDDVAGFDPEFFGIGEREATAIDPQHRLLLETAWEAMEHAGVNPTTLGRLADRRVRRVDSRRLRTACRRRQRPRRRLRLHRHQLQHGVGADRLPPRRCTAPRSRSTRHVRRVCSRCTWRAAACTRARATSLSPAVRRSCWNRGSSSSGSAQGMLSPTGHCHAFDVAADGFVSSEGCAVVLLKRLPDAMRDGDRILAVVRGTAANQDGHTVNIATPSRRRAGRGVSGRAGRGGRGRRARSAWWRRTAPVPRSATPSNSPAWPRYTAPTARAHSAR